jgi:hypothetical protein
MNALTAPTFALPLPALETLKKLEEASAIIQRAYARSPRAKKEASKKALELFKQYAPKAVKYLNDSSAFRASSEKKEKALSLLPALSLICHENTSHGPPSELDSITETRSS